MATRTDITPNDAPPPAVTPKAIARKRRKDAISRVWKQYRLSWMGMAGLGILVFFVLIAVFAPLLADKCDLSPICHPDNPPLQPPNSEFWFGTDGQGRWVLAHDLGIAGLADRRIGCDPHHRRDRRHRPRRRLLRRVERDRTHAADRLVPSDPVPAARDRAVRDLETVALHGDLRHRQGRGGGPMRFDSLPQMFFERARALAGRPRYRYRSGDAWHEVTLGADGRARPRPRRRAPRARRGAGRPGRAPVGDAGRVDGGRPRDPRLRRAHRADLSVEPRRRVRLHRRQLGVVDRASSRTTKQREKIDRVRRGRASSSTASATASSPRAVVSIDGGTGTASLAGLMERGRAAGASARAEVERRTAALRPRRPRDDRLHLGHDRSAEGRAPDARQPPGDGRGAAAASASCARATSTSSSCRSRTPSRG